MGPGDDAAVWGEREAITLDTMVEGVHWDARLSPRDVGYKLVAVSVSDLGAIGAKPKWMLLSLSIPSPPDDQWVSQFAQGMGEAAHKWGISLLGGDTTRSPVRVVSITMGGELVADPVLRKNAQPGDLLWITGWPGLAGAGDILENPPPVSLDALRHPEPPLAFALDVARHGLATAMMDTSDGLASDLPRLARTARVAAELHPELLPLHPCLAGQDRVALQVGGGDDFQILLTAPPERGEALRALAAAHGVQITQVGRILHGEGARLMNASWPAGFSHFQEVP